MYVDAKGWIKRREEGKRDKLLFTFNKKVYLFNTLYIYNHAKILF